MFEMSFHPFNDIAMGGSLSFYSSGVFWWLLGFLGSTLFFLQMISTLKSSHISPSYMPLYSNHPAFNIVWWIIIFLNNADNFPIYFLLYLNHLVPCSLHNLCKLLLDVLWVHAFHMMFAKSNNIKIKKSFDHS